MCNKWLARKRFAGHRRGIYENDGDDDDDLFRVDEMGKVCFFVLSY
jgi:hypothetical protein